MRVGFFLGCDRYWGGTYQYNLSLLQALLELQARGHEVVVAYADPDWAPVVRAHALTATKLPKSWWSLAMGIAVTVSAPAQSVARRLATAMDSVARALVAQRCDVWLFSAYSFNAFQFPVPSIGVIHDLMHRYEPRFPEVSIGPTFHWRERVFQSMCRYASAILVDSEVGKQQVIESYGARSEQLHVLPYIAPPHILSGEEPADFRERFTLPPKYLFYPAQFWPHKNHANLVRAVAALASELPDLHLVLVGAQKRGYEKVAGLVDELGLRSRVTYLGSVLDEYMAGLYRRARALVLPTFFGPTNIPPLEAMALGCPMAVSGIYGMPAQVGDAALLFDPNSVEDMAGAIRRLWTDDALCAKLSSCGRERAAKNTQREFNQRFSAIIEQVGVELRPRER